MLGWCRALNAWSSSTARAYIEIKKHFKVYLADIAAAHQRVCIEPHVKEFRHER
jgi:hypothetical protein